MYWYLAYTIQSGWDIGCYVGYDLASYQLTLIIMQPLFLFFAFTLLTTTHTHYHSPIHHVAFLHDKLFIMDQAQRQFSVLSISTK